ncbi:MAG TPA: VOC family protein [Bacillales bacterium]|nr:VOC family protein [Bacillales bacterium]
MSETMPFEIAYIQIPVKDPERSAEFYKNVLGMTCSFPYNPEDRAAFLKFENNIALGLIQSETIPDLTFRDSFGEVKAVIQFTVDNIESFYESLKAQNVPVGPMTFKEGGGYNFTVKDPDGHLSHVWGGWPES